MIEIEFRGQTIRCRPPKLREYQLFLASALAGRFRDCQRQADDLVAAGQLDEVDAVTESGLAAIDKLVSMTLAAIRATAEAAVEIPDELVDAEALRLCGDYSKAVAELAGN